MSPNRQRSSHEIHRSLGETRRNLEADLNELEERVETSFNPRRWLARHPAIMTIAGGVVGVLVVRNPRLVASALTRMAQIGAPFLVKAFLARDGSKAEPARAADEAEP